MEATTIKQLMEQLGSYPEDMLVYLGSENKIGNLQVRFTPIQAQKMHVNLPDTEPKFNADILVLKSK